MTTIPFLTSHSGFAKKETSGWLLRSGQRHENEPMLRHYFRFLWASALAGAPSLST